MTYLNTLQAEGSVFRPTFGDGDGWLRLPIDHPAHSRMIARNNILHSFIRNLRLALVRWRKAIAFGVDGAAAGRVLVEASYDDGVAHAEVPTSTVRFQVYWFRLGE